MSNNKMGESKDKLTCSIAPSGRENKYIDLMRAAVRMLGIKPLPRKKRSSADYVWHHWVEKLDSLSVINLLAATKKKIIWNVHNKIPHDTENRQKTKMIMFSMASIAHKIVIHCQESVDIIKKMCPDNPDIIKKIVYVPHPNYIGIYGSEQPESHLRNDKLSLCFLGKIKAYKNIELLIGAIKELGFDDVELKIIGRCWDTTYFQDLIGDSTKIKTNFRFVADEELPEIAASSHLFVFPYNLESSLNSGATLLAFSYGRSVLSSLTGTLADIKDKSMFFSYTYSSPDEHKEALKQQIISIRDRYKGCYNDLLILGKKCREYVAEHNSLEQVSKHLALVFDNKEQAPKNIRTYLASLQLRLLFPWLKIRSFFRKACHVFKHR